MNKNWALVKNGIVVNKIVAADDFIPHISGGYDYIVDITNCQGYPDFNWSYDGTTFTPPSEQS